jgi:hypothetical protein
MMPTIDATKPTKAAKRLIEGARVAGSALVPTPGPYCFGLQPGSSLTMDWRGPPMMPFALFIGPLNAGGIPLGCLGSADIGIPPELGGIVLLFDGTAPGLPSIFFRLGATGTATHSFTWSGPPGLIFAMQRLVFQPALASCPFMPTAAHQLTTY